MGSIITIVMVSLLILNNSQVVLADEQQQNGDLSNANKKDRPTQDRPTQEKQKPLDFSDTGRPGQQTAGESRGGCIDAAGDLEAVIPISHSGQTTSGHPSFWVYFPYTSQQVHRVEFTVQNEGREDIWRSQVKLDRDIGYKSFSIPKTAAPLEENQWYRWYVKVYCDSQLASAEYVQGWVRRVPLLSKVYLELQHENSISHQTYGNHGIWYDAIDRLLRAYQSEPTNILEQDWQNLIRARGVELHQLPEVGSTYKAIK